MKPQWYTMLKRKGKQLGTQQQAVGQCVGGQEHQFELFKQTVRPDLEPVKLAGGHERHYNGPPQYDLIVQGCLRCQKKQYTDMRPKA